jgi:hypothetical protein
MRARCAQRLDDHRHTSGISRHAAATRVPTSRAAARAASPRLQPLGRRAVPIGSRVPISAALAFLAACRASARLLRPLARPRASSQRLRAFVGARWRPCRGATEQQGAGRTPAVTTRAGAPASSSLGRPASRTSSRRAARRGRRPACCPRALHWTKAVACVSRAPLLRRPARRALATARRSRGACATAATTGARGGTRTRHAPRGAGAQARSFGLCAVLGAWH